MTEIAPPRWCLAATEEVQQGDIWLDFTMIAPRMVDQEVVLARSKMNVILLTQTCDLSKPAQSSVLLAQVYRYSEAASRMEHLKKTDYKKSLVEGTAIADFLIPPCEPEAGYWMLVHFRNVFSVPKEYLLGSKSTRIELTSPYREYFSQAYARFLMRVGLPSGLQPFLKQIT